MTTNQPLETIYFYNVRANSIMAHCGLRLLTAPTGDNVVIATELPDNPGMSITNAAEEVAAAVCRDFGLEPERLVWIEHYPERLTGDNYGHRTEPASFDAVTFTWDGQQFSDPQWRRLAPEELAFLTGLTLPVHPDWQP